MKKELNYFYFVQENENIDLISKKLRKNPLKILICNKITPFMIKKGLIIRNF